MPKNNYTKHCALRFVENTHTNVALCYTQAWLYSKINSLAVFDRTQAYLKKRIKKSLFLKQNKDFR